MKTFTFVICLALLLVGSSLAQTPAPTPAPLPSNFFGVVGGFTQNLPQQRATGGIVYGHNAGGTLWAFTRVEVLGVSRNPVQAQTVITEGACDVPHVLLNGRLLLGWCLDGGVATGPSSGNSTTLTGALSTEGLAVGRFGKKLNWGVGVMGGFTRTGVSGSNAPPGAINSTLTPIRITVMYGW